MSSNQREINYQFLTSSKNFLYDAREDGKTHTPFHYELLLFRAIQNGDRKGVEDSLTLYQNSGLIIGHMSDNPLREIHYWAVSTIAVAIHYAILGGLDESESYLQFTVSSGLHSVLERPFSEANGHPFFVKKSLLSVC